MGAQVVKFARRRGSEGIPLQDLVLGEVECRAGTAADIARRVAGLLRSAAQRRGEDLTEVPTQHAVLRLLVKLEADHLVVRDASVHPDDDVWHAAAWWPPEAA